jgi:hypothetical protein
MELSAKKVNNHSLLCQGLRRAGVIPFFCSAGICQRRSPPGLELTAPGVLFDFSSPWLWSTLVKQSRAKKTGWTGPHPAGHEIRRKRVEESRRKGIQYFVLTILLDFTIKQIPCHYQTPLNYIFILLKSR